MRLIYGRAGTRKSEICFNEISEKIALKDLTKCQKGVSIYANFGRGGRI